MLNLNKLFLIAYNTLLGNIPSYNITASINGILINMKASYQQDIITLQGSVTIQAQSNSLSIQVYFGQYLVDSVNTQVQVSPGTYAVVYALTIIDDTGIISNSIGLTVTNQLKSVSISTNASSYTIALTQDMLTFYLAYTSYPSTISITVTFTLTSGSTVTGSYQTSAPALPQGIQLYGTMIPVTFY
jgi:hypothetical protein